MIIVATCPHCNKDIRLDPAAIMGRKKSEAKTVAARINAKLPRPGAKGKKKPRRTTDA